MSIIKAKRGNVIYIYDKTYKDGKQKWEVLGHLDEAGNFIPSKKMRGKKPEDFPAQIQKVTTTTTKIRVVEKSETRAGLPADCRKENNRQEKEKQEPIEPKIANNESPASEEKTAETNEKAIAKFHRATPLSLMFNGKVPNALGRAKTKGKFDPATRALTVEGVNIFSTESVQKIGVGTAKIFRYAVAEFTKRNHQNATGDKINSRIFLDVEDFAIANGVDITSTDAMKNFRRKIKNSLNILLTSNITWTEKIKGKEKSYSGMNYIGKYDLDGNALRIEFTISMAEYLASLPLINYPRSLYKLDDRDFNAFAIGEAMCIHYSQDNNVIRQTEGKLRVETLLKCTSFPDYDELKKHKWSWERYVKDPFENALDKLSQCGFLKDWNYCYAGDIDISDEEISAGMINSYEKFISLIIKFELSDYEESKIRAVEIKGKKAERIKKLQAKSKTKEKPDNN